MKYFLSAARREWVEVRGWLQQRDPGVGVRGELGQDEDDDGREAGQPVGVHPAEHHWHDGNHRDSEQSV